MNVKRLAPTFRPNLRLSHPNQYGQAEPGWVTIGWMLIGAVLVIIAGILQRHGS